MRFPTTVCVLSCVTLTVIQIAAAAEITDVADAADILVWGDEAQDDAFDFYGGPELVFEWQQGRITREPLDRPGLQGNCTEQTPRRCSPVDELQFRRTQHQIKLNAQAGLYRDLALTLSLPFVIEQDIRFLYAQGVDTSNSTVDNGNPASADYLFPNNFQGFHSGLGALEVGLRWSPLNDERDKSVPAWLLAATWAMPWTAKVFNPAKDEATRDSNGGVNDGVHRLTLATAFSKRVGNFGLVGIDPRMNRRGYAEPYMGLSYTIPVATGDAPKPLRYSKDGNPFGRAPSGELQLDAGLELVPFEDVRNRTKVAIDLGFRGTLFTEGRNFSVLSDPLREFTFTEQHFRLLGRFGVIVQANRYVRLKAAVSAGYITDHFLTSEVVGTDGSGNGQVLAGDPGDQINPYFRCNRNECAPGELSYDQVGLRFRQEGTLHFQAQTSIEVNL